MTTIPASMALNAYARAAGMGGGAQAPQNGPKEADGAFGDVLKQAMNQTVSTSKAG